MAGKGLDYTELHEKIEELYNMFAENVFEDLIWTDERQRKANQLIHFVAIQLGVYDEQYNNERDRYNDLQIGKEKPARRLTDVKTLKERMERVLEKNDKMSPIVSLAIVNRCAHACKHKQDALDTKMKQSGHRGLHTLSEEEIQEIKRKINQGTVIKGYSEAQIEILKQYIKLEEERKKLYWIKDQYIAMIGQLIKTDEDYGRLTQEMYFDENKNIIFAIDYPQLAYIVKVHVPQYIAYALVKNYGLEPPIKKNGAKKLPEIREVSTVYYRRREDVEMIQRAMQPGGKTIVITAQKPERIKAAEIRRDILARNISEESESGAYRFKTKVIIIPSDISTGEEYLGSLKENFIHELLHLAEIRSDEAVVEGEKENKIAKHVRGILIEQLKRKEGSEGDGFFEEFKSFAKQAVKKKTNFEQLLYTYAASLKNEVDFITCMAYEKVLRERFVQEYPGEEISFEHVINFILSSSKLLGLNKNQRNKEEDKKGGPNER